MHFFQGGESRILKILFQVSNGVEVLEETRLDQMYDQCLRNRGVFGLSKFLTLVVLIAVVDVCFTTKQLRKQGFVREARKEDVFRKAHNAGTSRRSVICRIF